MEPFVVKQYFDDFSDDEIIEEMDRRGYECLRHSLTSSVILQDLYELKRSDKTAEFNKLFSDYCYQEIGRVL